MSLSEKLLATLSETTNAPLITGGLRGIEKESLRVTATGELAQTPHPRALGSALTHPQITTDYSEALLEFITPPSHRVEEVLKHLEHIHRFSYQQLDQEYLWVTSMPCDIKSDNEIPVAYYGSSNAGSMKTIYRLGLGHRYGRLMQTIAGIHYNYSLPSAFWAFLHNYENSSQELQEFTTQGYFSLIRNFRRYYWLLIYLYGAAPAVCRSFVDNRDHSLQPFGDDRETFYAPYGTSLRMGNLGYQSAAQHSMIVCYNNLDSYLQTLCGAITRVHPQYETLGLRSETGEYKQLNTSLLQIENEFYSSIRPKRSAHSGETALGALNQRGVEYVEIRCVDLNPYDPLGINAEQIHFLDTFLLYCLLEQSPQTDNAEYRNIQENQRRIVYRGRDPQLTLCDQDRERNIQDWGTALLDRLGPVAELLDNVYKTRAHTLSLAVQQAKMADAGLTPSARILADMRREKVSFFRFAMNWALKHSETFMSKPLDAATEARFRNMAQSSLFEQQLAESSDTTSFDDYLKDYYDQYKPCHCPGA